LDVGVRVSRRRISASVGGRVALVLDILLRLLRFTLRIAEKVAASKADQCSEASLVGELRYWHALCPNNERSRSGNTLANLREERRVERNLLVRLLAREVARGV
jgi:hypothetical protein